MGACKPWAHAKAHTEGNTPSTRPPPNPLAMGEITMQELQLKHKPIEKGPYGPNTLFGGRAAPEKSYENQDKINIKL